MTGPLDDDRIAALVDGELTPAEAAAIEAEAAGDPALATRIRQARALRAAVGGAYADSLSEPVPGRLLAAIGGGAEVVSLADARARRTPGQPIPSAARWGAIAASIALAFVAGRVLTPAPSPGVIASAPGGGLAAQGALAEGLQGQLASSQPGDAPVRIGVSFQATDGDYCRTFTVRQARPVAGLACRDPGGWRVRMAVEAAPLPAQGGYRTAGEETPAPVLEAMDQMIRGEPLDAAGEANARASGWRMAK